MSLTAPQDHKNRNMSHFLAIVKKQLDFKIRTISKGHYGSG